MGSNYGPENGAGSSNQQHQRQYWFDIEIPIPNSTSTTNLLDSTTNSFKDKLLSFISLAKSKVPAFQFNICRSFSSSEPEDELCKAATRGDWKTAEKIASLDPDILSRIISKDRKETALHIATRFNKAEFVEKLMEKLSTEDDYYLEATNIYGNTALGIAAASGAIDIAKLMVHKHKALAFIGESKNATPPLIATRYKHNDIVLYLLHHATNAMAEYPINLQDKINDQMELLMLSAISADQYDIALCILEKKKSLAQKRDINGDTPLHIMARKSNAIASYKTTDNWKACIDKSWFKCMFKKTRMKIKANEMVRKMWGSVKDDIENTNEKLMEFILQPSSMLHEAARVGNVEFLEVLLRENPRLLRIFDTDGKNIFHVAVENRQEGVFNLIYDMKLFNPDDLLFYFDDYNISLLELAAKRADPAHLDRVSGAVFQMHSEFIWFKEVEKIAELTTRITEKREKMTARELFTKEHRELKEEGEKWVKKTANSCMLVATLIATVVFAAAFTVPGGKNETTGSPIFLHHKWFKVFMISDGIAMISSSTSILLFLSILTSRCAQNDFLFWLPLELVIGLGSLFLSVLTMVLAFAATFFLYYDHRQDQEDKANSSLPLLIIGISTVPIFWFCLLQWKLWAHALVSLHATAVSCWVRNSKTTILKQVTRGFFVH